jgi:hypothetical protein
MHARSTFAVAALVAALALATSGHGGETYRTPQDVFNAAKEAAKKKDIKGFMNCVTEESQDILAGGTAFAAVMLKSFATAFAKGDEAKKLLERMKDLDATLARHGLTEEALARMKGELSIDVAKNPEAIKKAIKILVRPVKDKVAFFGDVLAALDKLGTKPGEGPLPADAELKDVKVEGDFASGVVVSRKDDKERREPLHFKKVGGGWKIDLPLDLLLKQGKKGAEKQAPAAK